MTWRSRKILAQNSQIHTIDLESNKFRGRKHSEFHSNDLEFKKNPLNFLENNMKINACNDNNTIPFYCHNTNFAHGAF